MGKGMTGGMGMLSMFKTENQQVAALTGAICAAGTLFYVAFNLSGTLPPQHRLPLSAERTAPAEWVPSRPGTPQFPPPLLARESRSPLLRSLEQAAQHVLAAVDPGAVEVPRRAEPGPDQRIALDSSFIAHPLCTVSPPCQ